MPFFTLWELSFVRLFLPSAQVSPFFGSFSFSLSFFLSLPLCLVFLSFFLFWGRGRCWVDLVAFLPASTVHFQGCEEHFRSTKTISETEVTVRILPGSKSALCPVVRGHGGYSLLFVFLVCQWLPNKNKFLEEFVVLIKGMEKSWRC